MVLAFFAAPLRPFAYSLLSHEQVVDVAWKDQIVPLLHARYPNCTPQDLRRAHACAYGGCLVQDLGYYPFGNKFFSDLTHYVRSGDFVVNLIQESTNCFEFAFALGALAHYCSDNVGHPLVNQAVALSFPKLRARYGDSVTYAQDPKAHIRTEFGFDMVQVAKNRYTSERYHDFIGFEVPTSLLERAFLKTYGLPLSEVLGNVNLAVGTFRRAVSQLFPELTHAALLARHPELTREVPNFNEQEFLFHLSRAEYERKWGNEYRRPSALSRFLAFLIRWLPKVGPLKTLDFKIPSPETEDLYFRSVNATVKKYQQLLHDVRQQREQFPNLDCDTGRATQLGEYPLADKAYAEWLDLLSKKGFDAIAPQLRENILAFYSNPSSPTTREARKRWQKTLRELDRLTWQEVRSPKAEVPR